jgi:hypothetical protein
LRAQLLRQRQRARVEAGRQFQPARHAGGLLAGLQRDVE